MQFALNPPSLRGRMVATAIAMAGALTRGRKGFWHFAQMAARTAPPGQEIVFDIAKGFSVPIRDPYWSRLAWSGHHYEPELEAVLKRYSGFAFFDCGANFGYWSVVCSGIASRVVAVEAGALAFAILDKNARRNGFTALHKAIHWRSGETVRFDASGSHAGAHIDPTGRTGARVKTIAIDDLVGEEDRPIVVKLDVEGAEIDAFRGATKTLKRAALFAYEDHGKDPESRVTAWLLANTDVEVWFYGDDGSERRIQSPEAASALKSDRRRGYNFFAYTAGWLEVFKANIGKPEAVSDERQRHEDDPKHKRVLV